MDAGASNKALKGTKSFRIKKFFKRFGRSKLPSEDENVLREIKRSMMKRKDDFTNIRQARVLIGTWNCGASKFDKSLDDWLHIPDNKNAPDIVAVGFQEAVELSVRNITYDGNTAKTQSKYWIDRILAHLNSRRSNSKDEGPSYVYLDDEYLVGILLIIFVKRELKPHVDYVFADTVGVGGLMDNLGNKGGVSIRFHLYDSTLCFVCSHLEAFQEEVEERNEDFNNILEKIEFDIGEEAVKELNKRRSSEDLVGWSSSSSSSSTTSQLDITDHDIIFWFGDLNYRVDDSRPVEQVIELCEADDLDKLIAKDQLSIERGAGRVFSGFEEGLLTFRPTYKYKPGTDKYSTKRAPAWCDRILWHTPRKNDIPNRVTQLNYARSEINVSDHRPVMASFVINVEEIVREKYDVVFKEVVASMK